LANFAFVLLWLVFRDLKSVILEDSDLLDLIFPFNLDLLLSLNKIVVQILHQLFHLLSRITSFMDICTMCFTYNDFLFIMQYLIELSDQLWYLLPVIPINNFFHFFYFLLIRSCDLLLLLDSYGTLLFFGAKSLLPHGRGALYVRWLSLLDKPLLHN
jgi:hypothetical protein